MLHELSHIYIGTRDIFYYQGQTSSWGLSNYGRWTLMNADTYAHFLSEWMEPWMLTDWFDPEKVTDW